VVEVLDDDLAHFEYGRGAGPGTDAAIETTDMICKASDKVPAGSCRTDYSGPAAFTDSSSGVLETEDIRLQINPSNLMVTVIDKTRNNLQLTTISPFNLQLDKKGIAATRSANLDVYGLGQQFVEPGKTDINWAGRVREGGEFGNVMAGFNGGANGNTQMPIMYAVNGATFENYALFLDNKYKQRWDFTGQSQWKVEVDRGQLRFYLMTGPDLKDLRKDYLELTGHPLVPPKKMFGLWISEYGYDNWDELDGKLASLQAAKFPVDGFVLDLQWFGGVPASSPISAANPTRMGSLTFDETSPNPQFANPKNKISTLRDTKGMGIMLIEEAYVGKTLAEHKELQGRGCLVKDHPGGANPDDNIPGGWWGSGGMIDYTNDACCEFWHDFRRQPLIDKGVIGHWTDLGEPEMFNRGSGYAAGSHADAHNIFNLRWMRGIYQGYLRKNDRQRPFMMSRSEAAGIQRFGAAMWSGDIGSNLDNLAAHAANQMNMCFSGIDFYGADIGGFHRGGIQNEPDKLNEMYTQWYAYGMMFDVPGRPHTENLSNSKETAPDRIGDKASNLENTRLRYGLIPYVYSLAHLAHRDGEPLEPPPIFYYQTDNKFRSAGGEKMIGRDLLAAVIARHGQTEADVRLPTGTWIDWHTNNRFISTPAQSMVTVPTKRGNIFRVPLFAREGAIIPLMYVDENTMNALGKRRDNSVHNELLVKVFAFDGDGNDGNGKSSFTLFEDDGVTDAYLQGAIAQTAISQESKGSKVTVKVAETTGTYAGAPASRNNVVKLVTDNIGAGVTLNGTALTEVKKIEDLDAADSGWFEDCANRTIIAKSGNQSVTAAKELGFTLAAEKCQQLVQCTSRQSSVTGSSGNA
jgi:alpha-glucosidase